MKNRRRPMKVVLVALLAVLLCAASFLTGRYYEDQKLETKKDAVTNDSPDTGSTDVSEDTTSKDTTSEDTTSKDTTSKDTTSKDTTSEDNLQAEDSTVGVSDKASVTYHNSQYGFDFVLPASWKGYTIETDVWQGTDCSNDAQQGQIVEAGIKIMIRHPEWKEDNPRQDIPIMIFTNSQWEKVEKEELAVSAAPIGPTKLGSNSDYVFALPARYNYAFPTGYEEVEDILANNPLIPNENFE